MSTDTQESRIEIPLELLCKRAGIKNFAELSRQTGIPQGVFTDIKKGRQKMVSGRVLVKLCDALRCTSGEVVIVHPPSHAQ